MSTEAGELHDRGAAGIAFLLRSFKAEKRAGYFVVAAILVSACVALWQSVERLFNAQQIDYLWPLAAAGIVGFIDNKIAAQIRTRAGRRLDSPAPIADSTSTTTTRAIAPARTATSTLTSSRCPRAPKRDRDRAYGRPARPARKPFYNSSVV